MNSPQSSPRILLHIPPSTWNNFRQTMLDTRPEREEVIGFLFCQRYQRSKKTIRYVPKAWVVPTFDCYEHQSEGGLVLKQQFHQYILDTYLRDRQLDVVHIHTHFGDDEPQFSYIDDRHEAEYAKFLSFQYDRKPRLISGVFNESLEKSEFRLWDRRGIYYQAIEFATSWFPLKDSIAISQAGEIMFERQKVFGDVVQQQLGNLTVALVGCGGIGAVFAEQLARLGVKNWVLVDLDRLETVNLNRMPGATQKMVDQWWYKVDYVKWLIKRSYAIGSHVRALPTSIEDTEAQNIIADADLIVVATDNHLSRKVAQEMALKYARPLMCLGTHIEVRKNTKPNLYCRITIPPLGEGWCLMCGNIINLQQAALESAPLEITEIAEEAGYISGIDTPAVYWLNSICASTGVGIIHGMLSGFIELDGGLDWVYNFTNSSWLKTDTSHLNTNNCFFCSPPTSNLIDEQVSLSSSQAIIS